MRYLTASLIVTCVVCLPLARVRAQARQAGRGKAQAAAARRQQNETLRKLGALLERDWKDRPEWAEMAAAALQGNMGPGRGWWKPQAQRYSWDWLQKTFDADDDGVIRRQEAPGMEAYLTRLDQNKDQLLTPRDLVDQGPGFSRESMMAQMLFQRFDRDSNGKLTPEELKSFFEGADRDKAGFLTLADLQSGLKPPPPKGKSSGQAEYQPGRDRLHDLHMVLSGQLGSLENGPQINQPAPELTLEQQGSDKKVSLKSLRGKPLVLIFGSFT